MKVYIASKFKDKEKVKKLNKLFREKGYELSGDWTNHVQVRPYNKEPKRSKDYSIEDAAAVKDSDIFILLTNEEGGTGSSTELGVAISSNLILGKPKIYVVGEHVGVNMFYFHPSVNKKKTIEELLKELK